MSQSTDAPLIEQVNDAYKNYGSILALSRSPLATSPLVTPALVLDPLTPTPEERGRGLQLALRWALAQLAPDTPRYPLGEFRPLDDPTWRDPAWWRYNILRHRYVEPLHPDDFVDSGRYTETLLALTGIPTADTLFDVRNRAIRAAAAALEQLQTSQAAQDDLQQQALAMVCAPLMRQPELRALLGIAAVLDDVFPRALLLTLANAENVRTPDAVLDALIQGRFVLTGDAGASLWMAPALRAYIYHREERARLRVRHERVADYFASRNLTLDAAQHLRLAERWEAAADLLLARIAELTRDLPSATVRAEVTALLTGRLQAGQRRQLQVWLSDLYAAAGETDAAIDACRAALKAAHTPGEQGAIFRRMGKLYEMRNQLHALAYYRQAEEVLEEGDAELVTLLKDRGWLHIHRRAWDEADADLRRALALAPSVAIGARADVLDALAALHRYQHDLPAAIRCAQEALALREQSGDLLRVAKSLGNLGLLYTATGEHAHAVTAHEEARTVAQRLGNPELAATATLNIGLAHHLAGDRMQAVEVYRISLAQAREINYVLVELRALSNLAEALAELGELEAAQRYWLQGVELARREEFDDERAYLQELAERFGFRKTDARHASNAPDAVSLASAPVDLQPAVDLLSAEDALALDLAQREGKVTPRRLMEVAHLSKATATRRLTALVAAGLLTPVGRGRGTSYVMGRLRESSIKRRLEIGDWKNRDSEAAMRDDLRTPNPQSPIANLPISQSHIPPISLSNTLCTRYGILAVGRVIDAPILVLRFAQLPDLLPFLTLQAEVRQEVGEAIEVLPIEALAPDRVVAWFEEAV